MHSHLSVQQMMVLFGSAVLLICALMVAIYLLQKSFRRNSNPQELKPPRLRVDDEDGFALASVKGVVTQLKTDQQAAQEKLLAAERRADENARRFELLAREIDYGLVIFDTQGFITFSNPRVRQLLGVDTWSRRRYGEIFQAFPALSQLISECFETSAETRKQTIIFPGPEGSARRVEVSVLQTREPGGARDTVVCMLRELPSPAPNV